MLFASEAPTETIGFLDVFEAFLRAGREFQTQLQVRKFLKPFLFYRIHQKNKAKPLHSPLEFPLKCVNPHCPNASL